jgi:hypothetical protein
MFKKKFQKKIPNIKKLLCLNSYACNRLYDGTAPPRSNLPTRWRQRVAYYRHKIIQCSKFKTRFSSKTPLLNDKRT